MLKRSLKNTGILKLSIKKCTKNELKYQFTSSVKYQTFKPTHVYCCRCYVKCYNQVLNVLKLHFVFHNHFISP